MSARRLFLPSLDILCCSPADLPRSFTGIEQARSKASIRADDECAVNNRRPREERHGSHALPPGCDVAAGRLGWAAMRGGQRRPAQRRHGPAQARSGLRQCGDRDLRRRSSGRCWAGRRRPSPAPPSVCSPRTRASTAPSPARSRPCGRSGRSSAARSLEVGLVPISDLYASLMLDLGRRHRQLRCGGGRGRTSTAT